MYPPNEQAGPSKPHKPASARSNSTSSAGDTRPAAEHISMPSSRHSSDSSRGSADLLSPSYIGRGKGKNTNTRRSSHSQGTSRRTSLSDISYVPGKEDILNISGGGNSQEPDARAPARFPSAGSCERANTTPTRSMTSLDVQNSLIPVTPSSRLAPSPGLIPSDRSGPAILPLDIHTEHVAITRMQQSRDHDYGCGMGLSRIVRPVKAGFQRMKVAVTSPVSSQRPPINPLATPFRRPRALLRRPDRLHPHLRPGAAGNDLREAEYAHSVLANGAGSSDRRAPSITSIPAELLGNQIHELESPYSFYSTRPVQDRNAQTHVPGASSITERHGRTAQGLPVLMSGNVHSHRPRIFERQSDTYPVDTAGDPLSELQGSDVPELPGSTLLARRHTAAIRHCNDGNVVSLTTRRTRSLPRASGRVSNTETSGNMTRSRASL